ncbi:MAG: hypothetical protein F6J87_14460 [Spirulina sp. SIO3F2]|nr:hypothetical protein [Spirulina sp. SIO3F2]
MSTLQSGLIERSKQGDIRALARLINNTLETKGIKAYLSRSDMELTVTLEAMEVIQQQRILNWLERSFESLDIPAIALVKVRHQQVGQAALLWAAEFELHPISSIAPTQQKLQQSPSEQPIAEPDEGAIVKTAMASSADPKALAPLPYNLSTGLLTLKTCFINPFALPEICERLRRRTAFNLGWNLGLIYMLGVFVGLNRLGVTFFLPKLSLLMLTLSTFLGFVVAHYLIRKVLRGQGSIEGDVFIIGATLMLTGVCTLITSFLGIGNTEIITVLLLFYIIYSVLMLYVGCVRISKIRPTFAPLATGITIVLGAYLTKVMVSFALSNTPTESLF